MDGYHKGRRHIDAEFDNVRLQNSGKNVIRVKEGSVVYTCYADTIRFIIENRFTIGNIIANVTTLQQKY